MSNSVAQRPTSLPSRTLAEPARAGRVRPTSATDERAAGALDGVWSETIEWSGPIVHAEPRSALLRPSAARLDGAGPPAGGCAQVRVGARRPGRRSAGGAAGWYPPWPGYGRARRRSAVTPTGRGEEGVGKTEWRCHASRGNACSISVPGGAPPKAQEAGRGSVASSTSASPISSSRMAEGCGPRHLERGPVLASGCACGPSPVLVAPQRSLPGLPWPSVAFGQTAVR